MIYVISVVRTLFFEEPLIVDTHTANKTNDTFPIQISNQTCISRSSVDLCFPI